MPSPWARRLREALGQIEPTSTREDLQGFPELERELLRTGSPAILEILSGEHNRLRNLLPEHVEMPTPQPEGMMPPASYRPPMKPMPQRYRQPGQQVPMAPNPLEEMWNTPTIRELIKLERAQKLGAPPDPRFERFVGGGY